MIPASQTSLSDAGNDERQDDERQDAVSPRKATVEKYIEGFRSGDLSLIGSCLTEDVVWALHGAKELTGRQAFLDEAGSGHGNPELMLDRVVEEGDTVAITGHGRVALDATRVRPFVFSEFFVFTGSAASRVETFHIWSDGS